MINYLIKFYEFITGKQSANVLAERHLEDARVSLLETQHQAEYHTGMVTILQQRIRRLEARRKELVERAEQQGN